MRILIVDDIPDNIRLLSSMLVGEGYEISTATSGRRALKIAENYPPDLILLDIMMPEMDGYEVCRALKSMPTLRGIPVIFITALNDEDDEVRGLELGAVDYITKPFKEPLVKLRVKTHLEIKRQREVLDKLSHLDGLTGIANRRTFDELFDLEWRRALRSGETIALLMIDVDYFKRYNDAYGHLLGDACLCKIAEALNDCLPRAGDVVARYGGEEFAALFHVTDLAGMRTVAERMRKTIEALNIPHRDSTVSPWVTASIGGAACRPGLTDDQKLFMDKADRQLYVAKQAGRNQISIPQVWNDVSA